MRCRHHQGAENAAGQYRFLQSKGRGRAHCGNLREYFAIAKAPSEGLESPTVVGAQAANELLNIKGVKASFVLTRYRNEVYISARAIDEVNVQVLMEKMGGGGHINIAGAQVQASMEDTEAMLKKIIDELYEEGDLTE